MKRITTLLALLLILQSSTAATAAAPLTPASYAVAVKWIKNGVVYSRIGAYSFRSNGSFRADYWQWASTDSYTFASARVIGSGGTPANDSNKWVQTELKFLGDASKMTTKFGSYTVFSGNRIRIDWNDGVREYWKRTWHDDQLNKIELYYLSAAGIVRDTYLYMNPTTGVFSRKNDAVNAGFGFGAPYGFNNTGLPIADFNKNYLGSYARWNAYLSNPNEGVKTFQAMNIASLYTLTSGKVWRYLQPKSPHNVFYYVCRPYVNDGMTSRRVLVQISHDWDDDGHVQDDYGHMYFGLQIIDHGGDPRGFVFADATWDVDDESTPVKNDGYMAIMSSMFYIDDRSTAAQVGIE